MPRLIVDAHEDLAWNAQIFGRDYTQSAHETRRREAEQNSPAPRRNGRTLLGLDDYLRGGIAVIFSALFVSPARRKVGDWETMTYADSEQAHRLYAGQMDYYHQLADNHGQFTLVGGRGDLERVLATWSDSNRAARQIGLVPLMEGADAIREPEEAEWWMERGVRIVGLAWSGTKYAGGTGEPGRLTGEGRRLLEVMAGLGLILDLSHATDESFLEALDRFEGPAIASHAPARALLDGFDLPERALSDKMIARLAERGGVMGIVPYNRFLKAGWQPVNGKAAVTVADVAAMIDHVCQLTGSADHAALGSDFDGGFGVEAAPAEIDTVADLQLIGGALGEKGYSDGDIEKVMSGNWLRILRQGLPE